MLRCGRQTRVLSTATFPPILIPSRLSRRFISYTIYSYRSRTVPPTLQRRRLDIMAKRKSSTALAPDGATIPPPILNEGPPPKRRASQRKVPQMKPSTNPDENANVLDAPEAFRASPDADEKEERINLTKAGVDVSKQIKEEDDFVPSLVENGDSESSLSDVSELESLIKARAMPKPIAKGAKVVQAKVNEEAKVTAPAKAKESAKEPQFLDPEADGEEEADEEEIQAALSRPPPVNSDYLPLPWKGRLGYVS